MVFLHKKREDDIISSRSIIKVAVDLKPGTGFLLDSMGKLKGLQKQLIDLLLTGQDSIIWVPFTDRKQALRALSRNKVHLYATSYPYTHRDQLEDIKATEWLYLSNYSLIYRSEDEDNSWQNIIKENRPIEVYTSNEDPNASLVLENIKELAYPNLKIIKSKANTTELSLMLALGKIDYLLCNQDTAHAIAETDTTITIVDDISFNMRQIWLVNSQEEVLLKALDSAIIKMRERSDWKVIVRDKR